MIWQNFSIGFWHPFGPHAGETPEEILDRKKNEIESNGWTLWSFQHRKTLSEWLEIINLSGARLVYTLCSEGRGAVDPKGRPHPCRQFKKPNDRNWEDVPSTIFVPHPICRKGVSP